MRSEKRQSRRLQIQEKALALFASQGFAATTMDQIAREAGLGTGTLYNYFSTKDDMLLSVVSDRAPAFVARFPLARAEVLATRRLDPLFDLYLESFAAIGKSIWRDLLAVGLASRPDLFAQVAEIDAPFIAELAGCLSELGERDDPRGMAEALYRSLIGTVVLWLGIPDSAPEGTPQALRQSIVTSAETATRLLRRANQALDHHRGE